MEFNLSEKIFLLVELGKKPNLEVYPNKEKLLKRGMISWKQSDEVIHKDNIKQFIKELKEKVCICSWQIEELDKLAGDELIN